MTVNFCPRLDWVTKPPYIAVSVSTGFQKIIQSAFLDRKHFSTNVARIMACTPAIAIVSGSAAAIGTCSITWV